MPLLLASSSAIRRAMLDAAGVEYSAVPAGLDEAAVKARLADAADIAGSLADAKALSVSADHPDDWVIGSDSVVEVGGRLFDKPADRAAAADHLAAFSGQPMRLTSAVALARGGHIDWRFTDRATLFVRDLSPGFIDDYLDREWPEVGYCVGVFRMEGLGVHLFDRVEGSHFTILGMPLIALLGALRDRGLIMP
ncbi:MAG: Maf family protein [Sphingomicrobium sp.]